MPIPALIDVGEQLASSDLDAIEKVLGCQLPKQYRDFLLRTNGGMPEPANFGVSLLHYFFSVNAADDTDDLAVNIDFYQGRVPKELIPIALDAGGNLVCIGVTGKQRGQVFFWDHEDEGPRSGRSRYDNVGRLAGSFNEFLSSFRD